MNNNAIIHRKMFDSIEIENYRSEYKAMSAQKQLAKQLKKPNTNSIMNRMGRPGKKTNPHSDSIQNGYMQIQFMREKERRKLKPNNKNLYTFFPTYTTLADKDSQLDLFFNQTMNVNQRTTKRSFSTPKQDNIEDNKQFMERRRLVPLKKHSPVQKRVYRPQPNITFLNVQKVSLIPISKQDDSEQSLVSKANFNKNISFTFKQAPQEDTKALQKLILSKNRSMGEQSPVINRLKAFTPPFQRYHYFDFIWKIALSNNIKAQFPQNLDKKFKIFIGKGNNSMLIKTFFKRRQFWWSITDKIEQANFVWTQLKVNSIHNSQKSCKKKLIQYNKREAVNQKKNQLYRRNSKILSSYQLDVWSDYYQKYRENQQKMNPSFSKRNKYFKKREQIINPQKIKIHNHLPRNYVLGNKKALFSTMKKYYQATKQEVFEYLPLTFHIEQGIQDPEYLRFLNYFYKKNKSIKQGYTAQKQKKLKNIWIVKPGEFSNRGNGITVCQNLQQIKSIVKNKKKHQNGNWKTYIVQQYLDRPMLYNRRKFDIRHYMLITYINGYKKGYWYQDGYIRTTSYEYSTKNCFGSVHLTNDAIQKNLPDYGKYEKGNKLSYEDFQKYLQKEFKGKRSFYKTIYPQMKKIAQDSMRASTFILDQNHKGHNFEVFGFDFMIDADFHPWLIEINTNPCLEISCPALMDIIPPMIQNTLKIGVDSILHPPSSFVEKRARFSSNILEQNKFQLLFDSIQEEEELKKLFQNQQSVKLNFKQLQKDEDEIFEDDGVELDD